MAEPQNSRLSVKHKKTMKISLKVFQISEFHLVYFVLKEGNAISNIRSKFQNHISRNLLKMEISDILTWEQPLPSGL